MAKCMQTARLSRNPKPKDLVVDEQDDEEDEQPPKSVTDQIKELFALLRKAKPNDANEKKAIDLIENVVVMLVDPDAPRDSKGKTFLLTAIESKNYALAKLLLEKGAGKNMDDQLLLAAKLCSVEAFKYMLDELKANIEALNAIGDTVVHCAVRNTNLGILRYLVDRKVNLTIKNKAVGNPRDKSTPILDAVYYGNVQATRILLDAGVGMEIQDERHSKTLLHVAARCKIKRNAVAVATVLLNHGAVFGTDKSGNLPLYHAALHDLSSTVELFLDRGSDINAKNNKGDTALHTAVTFNHINVVEILLRRGADIHITNNVGDTPLHESVRSDFCDLPVCQLLVDNGADIFAANNKGDKPSEVQPNSNYGEVRRTAKRAALLAIEETVSRNPGFKRTKIEDPPDELAAEEGAAADAGEEDEDEDDASEPSDEDEDD